MNRAVFLCQIQYFTASSRLKSRSLFGRLLHRFARPDQVGVLAVPIDPERDGLFADLPTGDVSASAPREGSDQRERDKERYDAVFQSTLPAFQGNSI